MAQPAAIFHVPRWADWRRSGSVDHPNLRLYAIAPAQLLAMKVQAGRPTDAEDITTLSALLGIITVDEVERVTRAAYPDEQPSARGTYVSVGDDWQNTHSPPCNVLGNGCKDPA